MNNTFITDAWPATLHERGYSSAARENQSWYLVERQSVIGITSLLEDGDDVISTYEPEGIDKP